MFETAELRKLQLAQCEALGGLKGHVSFMLTCHKYGYENERMWENLRRYHDAAERASQAVADYVFTVEKVS